jgi:hypothetical protein
MRFRQSLLTICLVILAALALAVPLVGAQVAVTEAVSGTPVTPDMIKLLFDANAIIVMFVWGLLCKYVPFLGKIPNLTIPWVNLIGYILTKLGAGVLGVGVASAAAGPLAAVPDAVAVVIGGFTSASWAMLLYEGWGRGLLERLLKIKKAKA